MSTKSSIINQAAQELRALRERSGLAVLSIERPDSAVQQALTTAGATFLRTWEERWCFSDTCNHLSHSGGTDGQDWEVPIIWLKESQRTSIENLLTVFPRLVEEDTVLAILPYASGVAAVVQHTGGSYAGEAYLVVAV